MRHRSGGEPSDKRTVKSEKSLKSGRPKKRKQKKKGGVVEGTLPLLRVNEDIVFTVVWVREDLSIS